MQADEKIEVLQQSIKNLCENDNEIFKVLDMMNIMIQNLQEVIKEEKSVQRCFMDNLKYELSDPRWKEDLFFPIIKSHEECIEKIVKEGKSLARFGDGEFSIMENIDRQKFQHLDQELAGRLQEVIASEDERILIGIADNYGNLDKYTRQSADGIRVYMTDEIRKMHQKYLKEDKEYYDAYVSRPYVIYCDKEHTAERFANLQRIWDKRNVIILEGAQTRLGIGNDLMDNARSVRRILGPATSSFDRYDDILRAAVEAAEPDVLFLIALGPCAGVAAYDLTKAGYQAIDIGHVDLEYEWYLAGAENRGMVKNKYNNEVSGGEIVEETELPEEYYEQIIADFS